MAMREIFEDEITTHLKLLLTEKLDLVRSRWVIYEEDKDQVGTGAVVEVYEDLQPLLQYTPSVEIVEIEGDQTQIAIGSQHEEFKYELLVSIGSVHPEHAKKYLKRIAHSVTEILNTYEYRAFLVPGTNFRVYDSYASNIEWGYRRGKGLLSAKIPWTAKLFKPDKSSPRS